MGSQMLETGKNMEERVLVAIDKDKSSQYALKWAIDHVVGAGRSVTLLHVKHKASSIPTPAGNNASIVDVNEDVARSIKQQIDSLAKEVFLPFRCFCGRRDIKCEEVILEDTDISKAITDYVAINTFDVLVVGAASKTGIVRRFKGPDVPSTVSKTAPEFCTVYTISKGKILTVRSATRPIQAKLSSTQLRPQNQPVPLLPTQNWGDSGGYPMNNNGGPGPRGDHRPVGFPPQRLNNDGGMEFRSPFTRGKATNGRSYGELSLPPEADISFVRPMGSAGNEQFYPHHHYARGTARPAADRMFAPNSLFNHNTDSTDQFGQIPLHSNSSSETSDRLSFGSDRKSVDLGSLLNDQTYHTGSSIGSGAGLSSSSADMEEVESEMRRLKLELKQTMDMYNAACKEAISAKQKANELQLLKMEERQRLEEARLAEEAALAIAEVEKAKCKAALEAAEASQRIAELEAQKRASAENKAVKEAEERKKALYALSHNNGMGGAVDLRYRKYSIEEIEAATGHFSQSLMIGEGGYGPVYKCTLDHTPVAIKVLRPDAAQGQSQFQQEVEILSCIRHPNMVLLLGACPEYGCLVYEYMSNGSLEDRLFRRGNTPPIPWQVRFRIAAEIGTGLLFLHQTKPEPLVHRDLKPGNILLDRNLVSKISDVGLARLVPPSVANTVTQYRMTQTAGTFCYIDPEYQQTGMLGIKSDVYSLGIILLQLVTAKPPMALTHHVERAIKRGTLLELLDPAVPEWPMELTVKLVKLALKCAEMRRKDRPDLGNVVLPELNKFREFAEDNMPAGASLIAVAVGSYTAGTSPNTLAPSQPSQMTHQEVISDTQFDCSGSAHDSPKSNRSTSSFLSGVSYSPKT